jgi:hypothetical protein
MRRTTGVVVTVGMLILAGFASFGTMAVMAADQAPQTVKQGEVTTAPDQVTTGPQPEIKFEKPDLIYDLGTASQGAKAETVIKFKNIGKGNLKIESAKGG